MIPYRLLILGHHPTSLDEAHTSVEVLTYFTTEAFRWLDVIEVLTADVRRLDFPQADVVLVVAYWEEWSLAINDEAKRRTGAIKTASLREVRFHTDHCFVFTPQSPGITGTTYFPLPCEKGILTVEPKDPGAILLDHPWKDFAGTDNDWTARIEDWLEPQPYKVSRLWYAPTADNPFPFHAEDAKALRPFLIPFPARPYPQWIRDTSRFERFIVTHKECYPWSVLDMAARGTQVLSPPGYIPDCLVADLGVELFTSREELLAILAKPVGKEWTYKRELFTDYGDIALAMHAAFKEWMA